MSALANIRWLPILLWGALAEILMIPPFAAFTPLLTAQYAVIPIAFLATLLGGWLVARKGPRPLLHGTLTGLSAYLFYLVVFPAIGWALQQFVDLTPPPDYATPPPPLVYPIANVMKVAGGAVGGWLASRPRT
jgi:hypothetical protein